MTSHQINSLVGDLVAMAQAMEELPKAQEKIEHQAQLIRDSNATFELLRADLEQSRAYASTLEQKVRDAEVAKDQAETMFLEADERTSRALDFIKASFGSAGALIQSLEPPKPEPIVEAQTLTYPAPNEGQSEAPFTVPSAPEAGSVPSSVTHTEAASSPSGQSEVDPTSNVPTQMAEVTHSAVSTSISEANVSGQTESWATPTPTEPKPQPYAGIRYHDYPKYVSLHDWLDGGGTEQNYYY